MLAYLVRRLLENGANSSFVNRIADKSVPVSELIADPVAVAKVIRRSAHLIQYRFTEDLYGPSRQNSSGIDLSNEQDLGGSSEALSQAGKTLDAVPLACRRRSKASPPRPVLNPSDRRDVVGTVVEASP